MRAHVLVEGFMEDHQLLWNRGLDDESPVQREDRCERQLKILLWAGLRALATMADKLRDLSGPWQLLDALGDARSSRSSPGRRKKMRRIPPSPIRKPPRYG